MVNLILKYIFHLCLWSALLMKIRTIRGKEKSKDRKCLHLWGLFSEWYWWVMDLLLKIYVLYFCKIILVPGNLRRHDLFCWKKPENIIVHAGTKPILLTNQSNPINLKRQAKPNNQSNQTNSFNRSSQTNQCNLPELINQNKWMIGSK